ncbi:hypothetical protein FDP41_006516 [Naegleria fowleri]|uniref:Myb-like domain-containing protein n=1 Tax=Naegleria fowleri TaxID=5763 RepID=A0A6A5BKA3_NAEFO|nr:uncharacterized protein FDP41_006516 [Naegleria fowleri]KAF0974484.1 hypothetical protein FDP41_006516 [Naegleria fowleri]CAG4709805.1 unnamed protein product [Naegleria fowleri]
MTNPSNPQEQTDRHHHHQQELTASSSDEDSTESSLSVQINTLVIEYLLYRRIDSVVDELLKSLPFDTNSLNVKVRLVINMLNETSQQITNEQDLNDRLNLIETCVEKVISLIQNRKDDFARIFENASFTVLAYMKKLNKWWKAFKEESNYEERYSCLLSIVKYINILGNYIQPPKLYSILQDYEKHEQENQEQPSFVRTSPKKSITSTPRGGGGASSSESMNGHASARRTSISNLPIHSDSLEQFNEPCTAMALGNPVKEDTNLFIAKRKSEPVQKKLLTLALSEVGTPKKKQPRRLNERHSDAKKVKVNRELASDSEEEPPVKVPPKATVKQHLRSQQSPSKKQKGDTSTNVFEEYSDEEDTERVLFHKPAQKKPKKITSDSSKPRQKKVFWSEEEVDALLAGYKRFGGNWAKILATYKKMFNPVRDSLSLRDKYRNLVKYGYIEED